MQNKIILLSFLMFAMIFQNTFAQKIFTTKEAEENKEILEPLLNEYQSLKTDSIPNVDFSTQFIFGKNIKEELKYQKKITMDFFRGFKNMIDEKEFAKKHKVGFEFDYILYFGKDGKLDYILYTLEPDKTKYHLNEKQKLEFSKYLTEYVQNYQSNIEASKKYKIFAGYIQRK